jgi:hypothetical protein
LVFEVRGLPRDAAARGGKWEEGMDKHQGMSIGAAIECEGGCIAVSDDYNRARAFDRGGALVKEWRGSSDHFANFIAAVRSRRVEDLAADIEEGHTSSALCHMGNIAYRLGEPAAKAAAGQRVREIECAGAAADALARFTAHLEANGVDLDRTPARLHSWLSFDGAAERFVGNDAANALLRRPYRDSFVVPERV